VRSRSSRSTTGKSCQPGNSYYWEMCVKELGGLSKHNNMLMELEVGIVPRSCVSALDIRSSLTSERNGGVGARWCLRDDALVSHSCGGDADQAVLRSGGIVDILHDN
jgi:hypothetical protein